MKKAAKGQRLSLRNNYLSLIISLLFSFAAHGQSQTITYTPMRDAGYNFKYGQIDSGFNLPNRDTTTGRGTRRGGSMVFDPVHKIFYGWDGVRWSSLGSGTGQFVDSITVNGANVCQWKAGVPTCYIVNTGGGTFTAVDSLTYAGNSICWWKNGTPTCYSLIPGVDSVTVVGSLLCQWVNGSPTCFTINGDVLGSGIDSVTVIGTQLCQWTGGVSTCYTINNTSSGIDSITVVDTTMCTWSGGVATCFPIGHRTRVHVLSPMYVDDILNAPEQTLGILHADGLISGGIVTKHDCNSVDVTPVDMSLGFNHYLIGQEIGLVVAAADLTNPRYDLVVATTQGHDSIIKGTPSVTPIIPSHNISTQIVLATIYIPAAASCLDISVKMIYNENLGTAGGEFNATSAGTITVDYNSTINPYVGAKSAYVSSHANNATQIFTDNVTDSIITGSILKGAVYINGLQPLTQWLKVQFFLNGVAVSDQQFVSTSYGLNSADSSNYQLFSIPTSVFNFSGGKYYNKIVITLAGDDLSGAKGFFIDWLQLQWGLPPSARLYVDSTTIDGGHEFNWYNGIAIDRGSVGGGGSSNLNIGSGFRWAVPGTNNIKTLFNGYAIGIDSASNTNGITLKIDSSLILTKLGAAAIYQHILTAGTNITIVGNTINAAGSSQTTNKLRITATGGQTAFTFSGLPASTNDYDIFINGMYVNPTFYSAAGTTVTFSSGLIVGDVVDYAEKK